MFKLQNSTEFSRMLLLQRNTANTRTALDRAALEMSTGQKADLVKATGGNPARLYGLERMLERNTAFLNGIGLHDQRVEMMQLNMGRMSAATETLGVDLAAAVEREDFTSARAYALQARRAFEEMVSLLNGTVASESLFAGTRTDRPALRAPDAILGAIELLVDGLTPQQAVDAIEDYFNGPGQAFIAENYTGSPDALMPADVGDSAPIIYALQAIEPEFLAMLKGLATAAMVGGGPFEAAPGPDRAVILRDAAGEMLAARDGLLELRARTGRAQEAIEAAKVQRVAERGAYDLARANLLGADPFDAASRFQALQSQLENAYLVTARLATLRFANFMR
jgi:flagellar hook-associated protein 3 FlgL